MFKFRKHYFLLAILLFVVEVLIALYVKDRIIRPYVGDFLVVMLVYCALRSVLNISVNKLIVFTLLFAYAVEIAQYLNLLEALNLHDNKLLRIVLGSSFEWIDMLAYTLGVLVIYIIEKRIRKVS